MMKINGLSMFGKDLVLSVLLLGMAGPVSAADGQTVINQSRVKAGNVTPGDAAGFPVTLSRSGSYVLSGNLTVPANKDGIVIAANDVTIDLNGFKITGSRTGIDITVNDGITDSDVNRSGTDIRNGTIANFSFGIRLYASTDNRVEQIHARDNIFVGIQLGMNSLVSGNIASGSQSGIFAGSKSLVTGNITHDNSFYGIITDCPSNVLGNTAASNFYDDIFVGVDCTRSNNSPAP